MPVIHSYITFRSRQEIQLQLMQNGAPGHSATNKKADLAERGIYVIYWPPLSPDLNPIQKCGLS